MLKRVAFQINLRKAQSIATFIHKINKRRSHHNTFAIAIFVNNKII